jgi:programmed cell death protein 5
MEDELEDIRRRKLADLQGQIAQKQEEAQARAYYETQKDAALRKILSPDAKSRLAAVKLANPQLAAQAEQLVLYAYQQTGQKLNDSQVRMILEKLRGTKRDITIVRK